MRDMFLSLASSAYALVDWTPRLTVLTLHRVHPTAEIRPRHVERCFRYLASRFHVTRPSELDAATHHRRVALVTIDDGHVDAYRHIFPIARASGVPIALCVPTDFFLRGAWLWFDKIAWAKQQARAGTRIRVDGVDLLAGDPTGFESLVVRLKRDPPPRRDEVIAEMFARLAVAPPPSPPDEYRSLTADEMKEMLRSGLVELVGHTASHTIATVLPDADLRRELKESKAELEAFSGRPLAAFCYPNGGRGDFSPATSAAVREMGYALAFTSIEGTNHLRRAEPFTLRRVHVHPRQAVVEKLCSGLGDVQNRIAGRVVGDA